MVMFWYHIAEWCMCAWCELSNPQIITGKQNADAPRLSVTVACSNENCGEIEVTIKRTHWLWQRRHSGSLWWRRDGFVLPARDRWLKAGYRGRMSCLQMRQAAAPQVLRHSADSAQQNGWTWCSGSVVDKLLLLRLLFRKPCSTPRITLCLCVDRCLEIHVESSPHTRWSIGIIVTFIFASLHYLILLAFLPCSTPLCGQWVVADASTMLPSLAVIMPPSLPLLHPPCWKYRPKDT